jgi:SPP1 family phage portal protein
LLGNPVDYQTLEEYDIQAILDEYKMQTINDLDNEIAKDVAIFGKQYEYIYINEDLNVKSAKLDNQNTLIVYDTTLEHNKLFGIIYREIVQAKKVVGYEVIYADKDSVREYEIKGESLKLLSEKPHMFKEVPMIEYRNNPEEQGDFEQVISLIDAYNLLQSDRINDKEQLVDAILLLINMEVDSDDLANIKNNRVIANVPADADAKYIIKQLNEADTDILRQNLEQDIHKISMTPNMSDVNFIGNSSGVAIKYKLLAFEQNIKNKERYMERGLVERFKLYNNFLSSISKMQEVPSQEVDVIFKRNLPSNDFEISQMITNLSGIVDSETLISQLSFIQDASEIVELAKQEKEENAEAFNFNVGQDEEE